MFRYSFETTATPQQAFDAFTDFSDRRLQTWKGTLDPKKYELRDQGDSWAVVREGSGGMNIWVVLRYEWEPPGAIRWTLVDSNHCDSGSGRIGIRPGHDGGSIVETEIDQSQPRGLKGRAILGMQRLVGPVLFPRLWKRALDRYAAQQAP
jgi:polyketide cyclase/dehydrase/lipid transport protein